MSGNLLDAIIDEDEQAFESALAERGYCKRDEVSAKVGEAIQNTLSTADELARAVEEYPDLATRDSPFAKSVVQHVDSLCADAAYSRLPEREILKLALRRAEGDMLATGKPARAADRKRQAEAAENREIETMARRFGISAKELKAQMPKTKFGRW